MIRTLAILVTLLALPARSHAGSCSLPTTGVSVKKFWPTSVTPNTNDDLLRCTGTDCELWGYLFKPSTGGSNLPAVVYVHGTVGDDASGQEQHSVGPCEVINDFLARGYVVFMPFGRGVQDTTSWTTPPANAGFTNSGTYVGDYDPTCTSADKTTLQNTFGIDLTNTDPNDPNNVTRSCNTLHTVRYMQREAHDAGYAMKYLASLTTGSGAPLVGKITLMGHSFGGATVTLAANLFDLARLPDAIVDLSGAVLSWANGTKVWSKSFTDAVAARIVPMYMHQTTNESPTLTTDSTTVPFYAGAWSGPDVQMALFSDSDANLSTCPSGYTTAHCAHVHFSSEKSEVDRWFPGVAEFLSRNKVGP